MSRLFYMTSTLAISESAIEKIERSGNYWHIHYNDGSFGSYWDEHRETIAELFKPLK